jgi:hypothetical protein
LVSASGGKMNEEEEQESIKIVEENYRNAIKNIIELHDNKVSKLNDRIIKLEKFNHKYVNTLIFIGYDPTCYSLKVATEAAQKALEEK